MKYHIENFNGTLDFRSKLRQNWWVELHIHEYSEILYCKSGSGFISVNGRNVPLGSGEFVWIPPNYVHQLSFQNSEVVCAVFSNDFIPLFFSALGERRLIVSPISADELTDVIGELYLLQRNQYLKISGVLNMIAEKVIEHSELEVSSFIDGVLFQKVVSYLSSHYIEEIKLSELAKLFGYNEKYLSHALHSLTGIHFSQLLAFYRIEHAKKLLSGNSQKSVTTVALESGFSAINTFHRAFLKHTGMTPLQYRHNNR
ncbi:MAG: helix-turn-helix domain-containing protein [Ruminococcaceae bacterium]|nr:helix-turn-helix domain-containing protein [Oscillospiraceae bacterium]